MLTDQPIQQFPSDEIAMMRMNPSGRPKRAMATLTTFSSLEDSQILFDFDSPVNEENFIINTTSLLYKSKAPTQTHQKKLQVVSREQAMNGEMPDFNWNPIFSLSITHHHQNPQYTLEQPETVPDGEGFSHRVFDNLTFMCLNNHGRRTEVKSAKLKRGDFFRLGKTYFKVIQTHLSQNCNTFVNDVQPLELEKILSAGNPSLLKTCRICLMQDQEGLISPCKCKGSCQYVHLECLKTWLRNKVSRQDSRLVSSYLLSKFECELCKQQLPNTILTQGRVLEFVELHRPHEPYLIIQKLQEHCRDRVLYLLTPKDEGVRLGRGNQTDLRFSDLTMSRAHSRIDFKDGSFYLTDMGSKFGTLLLLQQAQPLDKHLCLQLQNKIYKFEVMHPLQPGHTSYL